MNPHLLLLFLFLIVGVGHIALWVAAVVSIMGIAAPRRALVWTVLTFVFPVLGPLAWFLAGRQHELDHSPVTHAPHDVLLGR